MLQDWTHENTKAKSQLSKREPFGPTLTNYGGGLTLYLPISAAYL